MNLRKLLISILLLSGCALGQRAVFFGQNVTAVATSTPGFVNDLSGNSTKWPPASGTYTVGTRIAGTVTCVSFGTCLPLGDGILSGNLQILAGMFNRTTTVTPSATDGTNTYTCATGSTASSNNWPFLCYKLAAAAVSGGQATITIGAANTTNVLSRATQFYNISALDSSVQSCAASTTTTPGCASVTTGAANDLVWAMFCPITPAVGSFTPGAGYTAEPSDLQNSCQVEWKVASVAGSVTPTATWGNTSSYIEILAAFTTNTSGTAPTGRYLAHWMTWTTPEFAALGSVAMKFPTTGNLLVATYAPNASTVTSVTDSNKTWTTLASYTGEQNNTNASYVINASPDATGNVTMVTSGTGDITTNWYDFAGMPTSLHVARGQSSFNGEEWDGAGTFTAFMSHDTTTVQQGTNKPFPTDGVALIYGGTGTNSFLSISSPTGCQSSMVTDGGESLSGPWPHSQNNQYAYCYFTSTASGVPTFAMTSTSSDPGPTNFETLGFYSDTDIGMVHSDFIQNGAAATFVETTTLPSTTSGNLVIVAVTVNHSAARTASKVCLGGNSTCSTGTQLTECVSCISTTSTTRGATSIWYVLSAPSAATKLDCVASASSNHVECAEFEVNKGSGGAWAIDTNGSVTSAGSAGTAGLITGPSITTTGTPDFCVSMVSPNGGITNVMPSGEQYVIAGFQFSPSQDTVLAGQFSATGAVAAKWFDVSGIGDGYNASNMCFK